MDMATRNRLARGIGPDGRRLPNIDPMTPQQMEASRRAVADGRLQSVMPRAVADDDVARLLFEKFVVNATPYAKNIDEMREGVGEATLVAPTIRSVDAFRRGDNAQGIRELAPHAITAATLGAGPVVGAAGRQFSRIAPEAFDEVGEVISSMPGVRGVIARQLGGRAPAAAGIIGATEGAKQAVDVGAALASNELPPLPAYTADDPQSVTALQKFLNERGYNAGNVDGQFGGNTSRAVQQYSQDLRKQLELKNSPEALRIARMTAEADAADKLANANKLQQELSGAENERRATILTEAEKRYANRANTLAQQAMQTGQEWVGPAIMGAAAMAGVKGIPNAVRGGVRAKNLDALAAAMGSRPTAAQKQGFLDAYRGTPIKDGLKQAGEMAGVYGALGLEMELAKSYLADARKELAAAQAEFNQLGASGKTPDGGKERAAADRVAKAKATVKKWEDLQGAGLHGMGYYTAGKMASALAKALAPRPSPETAKLAGQFKKELKDARKASTKNQLPSAGTAPKFPPPAGPRSGGQPPSTGPTQPGSPEGSGGAPGGGGKPSNPPNPQPGPKGTGQGTAQGVSPPFKKSSKKRLLDTFIAKDGKLTEKQALKLVPDAPSDKVVQYLDRIKKANKRVKGDKDQLMGLFNDGILVGVGAIGAGAAASQMDEDARKRIMDGLR